jgi:hypothetical protein
VGLRIVTGAHRRNELVEMGPQNSWARVAKRMQLPSIPVEIAGGANEYKERRGTSWASATRELRRLRHRIEAVGGSKDQWEAGVWQRSSEFARGHYELDQHEFDLVSCLTAFLSVIHHRTQHEVMMIGGGEWLGEGVCT